MPVPPFVTVPPRTHWEGRLYFNAQTKPPSGWTESYMLKGTNYTEAQAALLAIMTARIGTLCTDVVCSYGYVSDYAISGDSILASGVPAGGTYGAGDPHKFTDECWNVILIRLESGPLYRVIRPLRGVPNDFDLTQDIAANPYLAALNAYGTALKDNAYIFVRQKPSDPDPSGNFRTINNAVVLRLAERRAGRPTGLLRGQRRKKKEKPV